MEFFETLLCSIDHILDTKRKRHITGGVLLSLSLMFGSLAVTVMTIKESADE